jgi:hypothetical protein
MPGSALPPPDRWDVSLWLDPAEKDAIQAAAWQVLPPERVIFTSSGWEGSAESDVHEMALIVSARSETEALEQAARHYERVRKAAKLPDAPAHVVTIWGLPAEEALRRDDQLMAEASILLEQGRTERLSLQCR